MKQSDFIQLKEQNWNAYDKIIKGEELAEKQEFTALYRQLCHDITVAKDRFYSPALIANLNKMLLDGQQLLYQNQKLHFSTIRQHVLHTFPNSLYQQRLYILWAHIIFYGAAFLFFALCLLFPEFVYHNISVASLTNIESMYNGNAGIFEEERDSSGDFQMFGFYIYNNISIAFQCFVGGILLGFGTLFFLVFNGVYFGVISAHIVNVGYSENFFSFVITHGSFELTAIVLSGAAGFIIGHRLLSPGKLKRSDALKEAGKQAYPIVLFAFALLLVAAFVEAFWSSTTMVSSGVKFAVGTVCWAWIIVYLVRGCRFGYR